MGGHLPGPRMCQRGRAYVSSSSGNVSTLAGDVSSFPRDVSTLAGYVSSFPSYVSSFPSDVFTFPANVFSFLGDVFTFPPNVFSFPSDVFSFRGHVFSFSRRAPWRFGRLRGEGVSRRVRTDREDERGVRGCAGGLVAESFGRLRGDSPRTGAGRLLPGPLPAARPSHLHLIPSVEYASPMLWEVEFTDEAGNDRFFEDLAPLADDLYSEHLEELRKEGLIE